jgi:hypothetical protein
MLLSKLRLPRRVGPRVALGPLGLPGRVKVIARIQSALEPDDRVLLRLVGWSLKKVERAGNQDRDRLARRARARA